MKPTLLLAAHGTASAAGSQTTRALAAAIATARPELRVEHCFLDVGSPSLADALDGLDGPVVVVPLLLSSGYHVLTDIPAIVAGRSEVRVAAHLGPDPRIVAAVAQRLAEAGPEIPATTAMVAIASSQDAAVAEIEQARSELETQLGRPVIGVRLGADAPALLASLPSPLQVAVYLLAEGRFLADLQESVGAETRVAAPIGVHPLLIEVVLSRYEDAVGGY